MEKINTQNISRTNSNILVNRTPKLSDIEDFDASLDLHKGGKRENLSENSTPPVGELLSEEFDCYDDAYEDESTGLVSTHCTQSIQIPDLQLAITETSITGVNNSGTIVIEKLHQMIEQTLMQLKPNNDQTWNFRFIDSVTNDLNLTVKKINGDNLLINITSSKLDDVNLKNISTQLNDRLKHKGWISHVNNNTDLNTNNIYPYNSQNNE
jgi:hypothetical protein